MCGKRPPLVSKNYIVSDVRNGKKKKKNENIIDTVSSLCEVESKEFDPCGRKHPLAFLVKLIYRDSRIITNPQRLCFHV